MSIGDLPSNKLISLAMQGYNPFQPDCGIYCGGVQGIMYPNPTTLISPATDFDPSDYREPIASEYSILPPYHGLGIGNPGIDYRNPGHILGLLDTFCRMSYGISILKSIHDGTDIQGNISPAVDIIMPTKNINLQSYPLGSNDIYPSLSEIPSDWLNYFSVNDTTGEIIPDIRPFVDFAVSNPYNPTVNTIDANQLNRLFSNMSVLSYFEIIPYLRLIINELYSAAQVLSSLSYLQFTITNFKYFQKIAHDSDWLVDYDDPFSAFRDNRRVSDYGYYSYHCEVITPVQALHVLTGNNAYHDSIIENQYEYRSLTELNNVINLVPIHMVSASYQAESLSFPPGTDPWIPDPEDVNPQPPPTYEGKTLKTFFVQSFAIMDVLLNISQTNIDLGTIAIEGEVKIKVPVPDWSPYGDSDWYNQASYPGFGPPLMRGRRSVNLNAILTNGHSWDRTWLNTLNDDQQYTIYEEIYNTIDFSIDTNDFIVPFSKTFNLQSGCNTLKMRFFIKNKYRAWTGYPNPFAFLGYLRNSVIKPTTIISLTITATDREPMVYEVSA